MIAAAVQFAAIAGFPRVIGAIDGTHIAIKSPPANREAVYVNRKGFHSINVQVGRLCNRLIVKFLNKKGWIKCKRK